MAVSRRTLMATAALTVLAGCANADPLNKTPDGSGLVVGSQQYYSNEIVAELYAQMLEHAGIKVTRQYQIGQRETYMPELSSGAIDVFPEYGGNLLQYLDGQATATTEDEIFSALKKALPEGLRALTPAEASDQDSFNVTKEYAQAHGLASLADLARINGLKVAASSELESRPYGPKGLKAAYGVTVSVVTVEDSGGPLTLKALKDGSAQVANIYSANPSIARNGLVTLKDPKRLVLPQQLTPIVSAKVNPEAEKAIDSVNRKLTSGELMALNQRSEDEQAPSEKIASAWLSEKGLV